MVTSRPPPKFARSPPPSSSASPPPPSNSANPAQPMGKIVRFPRREGTPPSTTTATTSNNAPVNSAARPGLSTIRTIPTTAGGRQPIRRRPSPSPAPDAAASTLEGSGQAPAAPPAAEASSRPGFVLRRDGFPVKQQPQAVAQGATASAGAGARLGWKRRRPVVAEGAAASSPSPAPAPAPAAAPASSAPQEMPEAKRLQLDRGEKAETGTGATAPKSAPQATPAASVEASSAVPVAVEEQRRSPSPVPAPAADEAKAPMPPPSSDPSPSLQQQGRDTSPSDLTTPPPVESDTAADQQGSKAAVSVLAVGKPVAVEDSKPAESAVATMDVDPVSVEQPPTTLEGGIGTNEQLSEVFDEEDAESDPFVALIAKHADMMQRSTLWIEEALQSIRDDFSKVAAVAGDAGKARLGEMVRMSVIDLFEPAAECTRAIGEATDAFAEEVQRYCAEGGGKSDMAVAS